MEFEGNPLKIKTGGPHRPLLGKGPPCRFKLAGLRFFYCHGLLVDAIIPGFRKHLGNVLFGHIHKSMLVMDVDLPDRVTGDLGEESNRADDFIRADAVHLALADAQSHHAALMGALILAATIDLGTIATLEISFKVSAIWAAALLGTIRAHIALAEFANGNQCALFLFS